MKYLTTTHEDEYMRFDQLGFFNRIKTCDPQALTTDCSKTKVNYFLMNKGTCVIQVLYFQTLPYGYEL